MKTKKLLPLIILFVMACQTAGAQEERTYEVKPAQVTFFYPFSTNGLNSEHYVNRLSLNLIWGVSAGLDGVEFGGIGNTEKDFMRGAQFAGFANVVGNDAQGLQLSGFINVNGGNIKGLQVADFINVNGGMTRGVQGSGFLNVTGNGMRGLQVAGFGNFNGELTKGITASGFMNATENLKGAAVTGFLNIGEDIKGIQASGFMNIAEDMKGTQAAGFMNIADDMSGLQVSGFLNIADRVNGLQLGIINVADTVESGVPIGVLSIVDDGYSSWEMGFSETWNTSLSYRLGIDRLYNIFTAGAQFTQGEWRMGWGLGLGTRFPISQGLKGSFELLTYDVREGGNWWNYELNLLNQVRLNLEGKAFAGMNWYIGPVFNVMVSNYVNDDTGLIGSSLAPYTVYDETYSNDINLKMWPGVSAGIRF